MRTTVTIDGLLIEVERRATEVGSTVSRLIEDSSRQARKVQPRGSADREAFELLTHGRGGRFARYDLDKASAVLDVDDRSQHS